MDNITETIDINKKLEICPCCGRKIVIYQHRFNHLLMYDLLCLDKAGGTSTLGKLKSRFAMTPSEYNNFQKLAYFGLVKKENRSYVITELGRNFLKGTQGCPSYVKTRINDVVDRGPEVSYEDAMVAFQNRKQYESQVARLKEIIA